MSRARTSTPASEPAAEPEETSAEAAAEPAAEPEATPAPKKPKKQRGTTAQVKVTHGQLFAGNGVYHQKGAVLSLPLAEAEALEEQGVVKIID